MDIKCNKKFNNNSPYNISLLESEHFRVIPSLGSMVEGWVLIVPKKHYLSFIYLEDYLFEELNSLHNKLISLLKEIYKKNIIAFENGTIIEGTSVGCGVDYAHIHYIPLEMDIIKTINNSYDKLTWLEVNEIKDLRSTVEPFKPYLFVQVTNEKKYVCSISNPQSQIIRKAIANYLGLPEKYDWKQFNFDNNIQNTISKFRNSLTQKVF